MDERLEGIKYAHGDCNKHIETAICWLISEIGSLRQQLAKKDATICGMGEWIGRLLLKLETDGSFPNNIETECKALEQALSSSFNCPHKERAEGITRAELAEQARLINERDAAKEEVERLKADALKIYCVYCGILRDRDPDWDKEKVKMVEHMEQCKKRPELALADEIVDLQAKLVGAEERAMMVLQAKNVWADRARKAQEEVKRLLDECATLRVCDDNHLKELIDLRAQLASLSAEVKQLRKPKMFPLQTDRSSPAGPSRIPWSIAEKAYGDYSRRFGSSQSLARLAERGGFSWGEMDDHYPKWREEADEIVALHAELTSLREVERALKAVRKEAKSFCIDGNAVWEWLEETKGQADEALSSHESKWGKV